MSGFSEDWLDLREPADHAARNPSLTAAAAAWARAYVARSRSPLAVVDFGSGTGSNARFLPARLAVPQTWRLVDNDAGLLAAARKRCAIAAGNGDLQAIETVHADLTASDPRELAGDAGLLTASALFDLVSEAWCRRLIDAVAKPGRALLAVLTYDGRMAWTPADAVDAPVLAAFNRHQRGDKGFGPALGPEAATRLPALLRASGATVSVGTSDWRLDGDAPLHRALLPGLAAAASDIRPDMSRAFAAWAERRAAAEGRMRVGHVDIWAVWPA